MAGHQQLQKRRNRAPEAGIVRPDHPNVLPTPARDGGSEKYANLATFQTFSQNHPKSPPQGLGEGGEQNFLFTPLFKGCEHTFLDIQPSGRC